MEEERTKTLDDLISICSTYLNEESIELIKKAYHTANEMHTGQFRKSGDPYIVHPLEVACILASLHTGPATICAGLLHDVLEDTSMTKEEMEASFGKEITSIVDGVTKISKLKYMTKTKALAHNHEKLLIAMAKDIRVILVKLADRLHNMRTIKFQPEDKQKRISQETLDLYAPLAHRLGMYRIKAELEDLSFQILHPDIYQSIYEAVESKKSERESDIEIMEDAIKKVLDENHIENYQLKGRVKNIYSVYMKMQTKNKRIEDIFDLLALRIIVNTVGECYFALGLIHSIWTPLPMRFKDYIAVPKPNLYQSLHTTVVGVGGRIFEVQIRTYEMDKVAENGVAAHWAYKENNNYSSEREQSEIKEKMNWFNNLSNLVTESEGDDPLSSIREDIFDADIFIFTPNGDVFDLPSGSMPLDFAYRVHTEVGNKCVGAIVNGKIVPLSYKLKTGDVVEIKTNKNSSGPNESWLQLAKTSHAKNKIRTYLNKVQRDIFIKTGTEAFEQACKVKNYDPKQLTDDVIASKFEKINVTNYEDLLCEIGKGTISGIAALNKILGLTDVKLDEQQVINQYSEETSDNRVRRHAKNDYGILVDGLTKALIKIGNCCQPVPGDTIYGYISKGNGIVIHRAGCPNIQKNSDRFINVEWDDSVKQKVFNTTLRVFAQDRKNIVADMINELNSCNVTIVSVTSSKNHNNECLAKFKLQVSSLDDLSHAMMLLEKMPGMYSVERVFK